MRKLRFIIAGLVIVGFSSSVAGSLDFFEKKIRPVLVERCYKCHSDRAKMLKGGYRLDLRGAMRRGGDSGKAAVVPGKPAESQLLTALEYLNSDLQMPPKKKLPAVVVADFRAWIKMGAPDPRDGKAVARAKREIDFAKARGFWAFKPPVKPKLPEVKNKAWVRSPLDQFILARLEKSGFAPAPQADLRTLIRRATYDLTGLPPTPNEVDYFLKSAGRNPHSTFEKVIDRLLASPRYGEKWGRHWLDVARYADSNGLDENLAYINAFRYRNWVINAFNADLPYDQFVREQIAGDLLPEVKGEPLAQHQARWIATGFFCVGPKMLAEDDGRKMQMDIIDEQLDTLGRAFMGLTMGCARCHDHKFDPIPTRDYYALAGIFKSTKTMENFKVVAKWHEREITTPELQAKSEAILKQVKENEVVIEKLKMAASKELLTEARRHAADYLLAATMQLRNEVLVAKALADGAGKPGETTKGALLIEAEDYTRGNAKKVTDGYGEGIGVIYNAGELPNVAEYDFAITKGGVYLVRLRYAAAAARPSQLSLDGAVVKEKAAGEVTGSWYPDTQKWFLEGAFPLGAGRHTLKLECKGPFPHYDKLLLTLGGQASALAGLPAAEGLHGQFTRQWAAHLKKSAADAKSPFAEWHVLLKTPDSVKAKALLEKYRKQFAEAKEGSPLYLILHDEKGPFSIGKKPDGLFPAETVKRLEQARVKLKGLTAAQSKIPMAMTLTEGEAEDLKVHLRGNYLHLGEAAPRGFLRVISGEPVKIQDKASGRLELARWMTRPEHPLTARVMANRIWLWHFGEGLVRSPDNFGKLGQRPTHPALLDWLTLRFIEQGWSIKKMHRLLMLSATYQMASTIPPSAFRIPHSKDPANNLWWHFNRRRLLAEEIRDSLLVIDGTLEHGMQQQLMPHKPREYVTATGFKNVNFDFKCRSVYVPVIRSAVYPVMSAFDFGDPAVIQGQRASTVVAPQALFMMNDELVLNASQRVVERAMKAEPPERVQQLYKNILRRPPTAPEQKRALDFVQRLHDQLPSETKNRDHRAWQGLARVLFASNEFMFVD